VAEVVDARDLKDLSPIIKSNIYKAECQDSANNAFPLGNIVNLETLFYRLFSTQTSIRNQRDLLRFLSALETILRKPS